MPTAATTHGDTDAGRAVKTRPASEACEHPGGYL